MNFLLNVYRVQFKVTMATQLQYRIALVIWLIGIVLEPVIYLVVWSTVARSQGGSVGGYTTSAFAAYFIVLMLVNHVTQTWVFWESEYRIRQGTLSPLLLRPVHPVHADVAQNVSYKLLTMAVIIPAIVLLVWLFHPVLGPALWEVAAFVPALLLAGVLRFLVEWTIGLVAFWTTRTGAINQTYYVALLFFSGQVGPISLFPPAFQVMANIMPFQWMVAFPVELLLGRLSPAEVAKGFAAQIIWLAVSLVLLRVIWKTGLRKYSAVGA